MAKRQFFSAWLLPLCGLGMFAFAVWSVASPAPDSALEPPLPPSVRAFPHQVMGTGIVEPWGEAVSIAPELPGVVRAVLVSAGQTVTKGAVLFALDNRQAEAASAEAEAALATAESQRADAEEHLARLESVKKGLAVGESQLTRQRFAVKTARALYAQREKALTAARTTLERLTVRAPQDGTVLLLNIRAGEFAPTQSAKPLLLLGNTQRWQIRTEVDESQAWQIRPDAKVLANRRGDPAHRASVEFVRIEPAVVPKLSLTGDKTERVDTRVVQVLYALSPESLPLLSGQEMEVFIETAPRPLKAR